MLPRPNWRESTRVGLPLLALRTQRFAGFTVKASARLKLQSGYELAGRVFIACLARVECLCIAVIADHTNRQSETPTEKAGVSLIQICGQLIPVVSAEACHSPRHHEDSGDDARTSRLRHSSGDDVIRYTLHRVQPRRQHRPQKRAAERSSDPRGQAAGFFSDRTASPVWPEFTWTMYNAHPTINNKIRKRFMGDSQSSPVLRHNEFSGLLFRFRDLGDRP